MPASGKTTAPGPIALGIVGVGKIVRDQHLPALAKDPNYRLAAAASRHGKVDGILGVRPEHIAVGDDAKKMPFQLESEIEIVEPMGSDTVAWTKVAGQSVTFRCSSDIPLAPGQKVTIGFDPARGSIFDATSGVRV